MQSKRQLLGHFLLGVGDLEVHLVVLDRILRETTKKSPQLFEEKKVRPETKSCLRLCKYTQLTVMIAGRGDDTKDKESFCRQFAKPRLDGLQHADSGR